ncbi:MAG: T9SS type A sorting domain-containing protein [Bacteroidota bacterium]
MKTSLFIPVFSLLLLVCATITEAQPTTFSKVFYDPNGSAQSYAMVQTFDHYFMIAGEKDNQPMVMKMDVNGSILWSKKIGGSYDSRFTAITATHDSCFILTGTTPVNPGVENRIICVKITSLGDTVWTRELNMGSSTISAVVQETSDHGSILAGYVTEAVTLISHSFVLKLDPSGNIAWSTVLNAGAKSDFAYAVRQTPDGGYMVAGEIEHYPPLEQEACMIKLTSSGTISWAKSQVLPAQNYTSAWDVIVTNSGLMWYLSGTGIVLMKTDYSGNIQWSRAYNASTGSFAGATQRPRIHQTTDGGYVFLSSMQGFDQLLKVDSAGSIQWGQSLMMIAADVVETTESGYMVVGNGPIMGVKKSPTNNPQIGINKTDSTGSSTGCQYQVTIMDAPYAPDFTAVTFTATTAGSQVPSTPLVSTATLSVFQGCVPILGSVAENTTGNPAFTVNPNPSAGVTYIENLLPAGESWQQVSVMNILGKTVFQSSGLPSNALQVDLSGMAGGIYFITARYADRTVTQKLVLRH